MKDIIFQYIDNHQEEMLNFWKTIVGYESGSFDKEDLDVLRDFLIKTFTDMGGTVQTRAYEKAGDLIVADFNTHIDAAPIIFSGHYDTVFSHGTLAERPFTIKEDGRAYGPGAYDMKAGVTMATFLTKALLEAKYDKHPIRIVLAGDEEVGHMNSTGTQDFGDAVKGAVAAFNFESGYVDNGFVVGRKGGARATYTIKGVGAHAGNEPEKGRSAILEMAHKIIDIQSRTNFDAGITYNVGITKGGTAANAVPEEATMIVDIRIKTMDQLEQVEKDLNEVLQNTHVEGTSATMNYALTLLPMETTEGVNNMFRLLEESAKELNFGPIFPKYVGGGADSAIEVQQGVPTICAVGIAGGKNHTVEEFAVVETMFTRAKLVGNTVLKLK